MSAALEGIHPAHAPRVSECVLLGVKTGGKGEAGLREQGGAGEWEGILRGG